MLICPQGVVYVIRYNSTRFGERHGECAGVSNQWICPILVREFVRYGWWVGSRGNQEDPSQSLSLKLSSTPVVPPPEQIWVHEKEHQFEGSDFIHRVQCLKQLGFRG
jgi:hypothetical protein